MGRDSRYIHGNEPEEQARLSTLNTLLNVRSLDALRLRGDERVLDVGSGLGQLSRAMARALGPGGTVVAVERDPKQLAEALRQAASAGEEGWVDWRQGDAVELPLAEEEWGTFDLVHSRFVLEHVKNPLAVVCSMVRAARPGGRVVLEDDDHDLLRLWPEVPEFDTLWRAYVEVYDRLGNDPYVGRRLTALLRQAGAEPTRNDQLFFGSCTGDASLGAFVANFAGLLEGSAQQIVSMTPVGQEALRSGIETFRRWGQRDDAALWYVTCWAEGRRPLTGATPSVRPTERRSSGQRSPDLRPGVLRPDKGRAVSSRPRGKVSSMAVLAESATDLSSSLRLDEVLRKISGRISQLVDAHLMCIMLWNEESQLLEHTYSLRYGEHIDQKGGFPLGYGLSGSAAVERRPLRVADVRHDPRYVRFRHAEVNIRSELAVPLLLKERLVGVLDLESTELDAFTAEHEQIVVTLASHIAAALENARLYEELAANQRRIDRELATSRKIQRGLLPSKLPTLPGIELGAAMASARELSGDFFDLLPYGDGRIAIALGDVAGKSTPAALYGSLAVGILRGHALERLPAPGAMLRHLNGHLHRLDVERRFLALLFAVYDQQSHRLTVADAGVPPPTVLRGQTLETLDLGGVPLGGLAESIYPERTFVLSPGDLVAFCSDGLTEALGPDDEPFGDRRLGEVLAENRDAPAPRIAETLLEAVAGWAGGAPADDRTVVVLRLTGAAVGRDDNR